MGILIAIFIFMLAFIGLIYLFVRIIEKAVRGSIKIDPNSICIIWSWEDIKGLKPEWTEERCREALEDIHKGFVDSITQQGNEILRDNLPEK